MRITSILCLLALFCTNARAQNLVPNGSFEQYTTCPSGFSQIANCVGWRMYTNGSSDYFNSCSGTTAGVPQNFAGWQQAAQGNAYAGFYTFSSLSASAIYKEYIARPIPALQIGATYEVSMSVSLANNSGYGADDIGVLFYDTLPYTVATSTVLPYIPQVSYSNYGPITDTQNWVRVTKTFMADSAYDNIVIGGFKTWSTGLDTDIIKPGGGYAYYYVDSIVIRLADTLNFTYNDTLLCAGDTVYVPFNANPGIFAANNVFTLQLSNAAGSFASPVNIGTLATNTSGLLKGVVPSSITGGAGYRIRIVSSNPALIFGPNNKNIAIGLNAPAKPVAGSNSPVCGGSNLLLTATTTTTGVTWKWEGPMSFSSTQQNPVLSNFGSSNAGYYIVTASNFGCSSSDTELVNYATPVSVTAASGGPVCAGTNSLLFASGGPLGTTYSWTGPGSYTSNQQNPVITATTPAKSGDYIVVASLSSCSDTDTVSVLIKALPVATAATSGPACTGASITLLGGSDVSPSFFTWTGPAFSSNQQNPVLSPVVPAQSGTYTLIASALGCNSLPVSTTVTVYPTPAAPVATANTIVCDGSPLHLQMNTVNGASYFWSGPNSFSSTQQNPTINPAYPVHAGKYYAWVTVNGCVSPKDSVIVTVNYIPLVGAYASPNDTICEGTVATFVAQYNNGGATPTFQWYKNFVAIPGATTLQYATSNLVTGDRIHCTMHTIGVCTDPTTVSTDTIMMTVLPIVTQPSATISTDPEWPSANQLITFTAKVQNGGPDPKFQWQLNGLNMNGAIYSKWAASTLKPFDKVNCIITSNDPCATNKTAYSDTVTIWFPTNVVDVNADGGMKVYPNPNNGKFRITASNIHSQSVKLELLNTIGQVIYKESLEPKNNSLDHNIEISGVPSGIYMLKLHDGNIQYTERITIQ